MITFSFGFVVCLFGLIFAGFGIAKFRQAFTNQPTPENGFSPGQDVYLCAEVMPQSPSLISPLGGANCAHWVVRVSSSRGNARGASSAIIDEQSEGNEFFVSAPSEPIRVRFGLRHLPAISADSVELTEEFVTYSDQQFPGKKFSKPLSTEYLLRRNVATEQIGMIPKNLTLEEKAICSGQSLYIWGKMSENGENRPTLEATMISAKGATSHWVHGIIAILAGFLILYIGSGLISFGFSGP